MELKVWVDGIQRVVCGVSDGTTCQDVVYALAHATGQTGRFILVEKWRNSERTLAPYENPLKVLMKWGEYASDVHLIMRRSHADGRVPEQQASKRQHEILSPGSGTGVNGQKTANVTKEIKKSLTFSGSHGSGSSSSESTPNSSNANTPNKIESAPKDYRERDIHVGRPEVPRGIVKGIPQRPPDHSIPQGSRCERPKQPPPYDEAVTRSGRFASPSQYHPVPGNTVVLDRDSPTSKRRHVVENKDSSMSQSNKSNQMGTHSPSDLKPEAKIHAFETGPKRALSPSRTPYKIQHMSVSDTQVPKARKNLGGHFSPEDPYLASGISPGSKASRTKSSDFVEGSHDPQYRDLVRLVSLQREKLTNQQGELSQFDSEIAYWEGRLQEQEGRLSAIEDDIRKLERAHREYDGELMQLERRPMMEEGELGKQEERTLRSELTLARSQLANCETELLQCHQRLRQMLEEIGEEQKRRALQEEQHKKESEEKEQAIQKQTAELQRQLKENTEELENQKVAAEKLEEELKELENTVNEKKLQVTKLAEEIREANLLSLSLTPADDIKHWMEGSFYNRPGSTRKIVGSPRQLENAVPTNKNPNGVWV